MLPDLTREEILRYSRQLLIPEIALDGQRKLKASSALIIGTGGLGSPVSLYLAAAGVGHIGLVDFDVVDTSNLQRQVIHTQDRRGMPKTASSNVNVPMISQSRLAGGRRMAGAVQNTPSLTLASAVSAQ